MPLQRRRSALRLRPFLLSILLLALAGSTACDPEPQLEQGWVPDLNGRAVWATYEVKPKKGIAIHEDDMVFDLEQLRAYQQAVEEQTVEQADGGVTPYASFDSYSTWPDAEVVYDGDSIAQFATRCTTMVGATCIETQADLIRQAIQHWNDNTDFVIRPRTAGDDYWFRFVAESSGCRSDVGYKDGWVPNWVPLADDPQRIFLGPLCSRGNIIHEIGHTIGFRHEQARSDRGAYVVVLDENVQSGKGHNFDRGGKPWGEYDYRSIMHYPPKAFGKNDGSGGQLVTIQSLIPLPSGVMGQRQGLSRIDIGAANGLANRAKGLIMPSGTRAHFEPGAGVFPDDGGALPDRVELANVDGDAHPDLVAFRPDPSDPARPGQVLVARGQADGTFGATEIWNGAFCAERHECTVGDFDGDGLDDVVSYDSFNRDVVVALSDGTAFLGSALWQVTAYLPGAGIRVGDVDGDCRDDLLVIEPIFSPTGNGTIRVHVGLSGGDGFTQVAFWREVSGVDVVGVVPFDADALADLITVDEHGTVRRHASLGSAFSNELVVASRFCLAGTCKLADVNGDGRDDLVVERPDQHHFLLRVQAALHDGSAFRTDWTLYHEMDCMSDGGCLYGDLDGDGDADAVEPLSYWDGSRPGSELYRATNGTRLGTSVTVGITAACVAGPPPPSASPWQQLSDFPVDQVVGTRNQVYARTGSQVLHHVWNQGWVAWPGSWQDVAATGDEVFGVSSGQYIYRADSDSQFTDLSNNMADAVAGVGGMLSVEASVGDLYAWDCFCGGNFRPGWTKLPSTGPAWTYAMGGYPPSQDDVGRTPILVRQAFTGIQLYDFWTATWENINTHYQVAGIWAGGSKVYVRAYYTLDLMMWTGEKDASGAYRWFNLGSSGAGVAVDPDTGEVYRLSSDKSRIERYDGGGQWTKVGGPADRIWVAGGRLIASSPASGNLFALPVR